MRERAGAHWLPDEPVLQAQNEVACRYDVYVGRDFTQSEGLYAI